MITKAMFNNVSLLSRRRKKTTKQVYMQLLRLHQIHTEKSKTSTIKILKQQVSQQGVLCMGFC